MKDYTNYVHNIIASRLWNFGVRNHADVAEDLAQDVMVQLTIYGCPNNTYAYLTCRSVIADYFKKKRNFAELHERTAMDESVVDIEEKDYANYVLSNIKDEALLLLVKGNSYKGISKKMKIPYGTVNTRIFRERERLKDLVRR